MSVRSEYLLQSESESLLTALVITSKEREQFPFFWTICVSQTALERL